MKSIAWSALLFLLCLLMSSHELGAQEADTSAAIKGKWLVLPLVFFTPETSWGFGGAGLYSFRFKGNSPESRPSQIQLGFAYTLRKQILSYLPFQLFLKNDQYKLYGELGYYRYIYEFSGIGNEGTLDESELYSVNYPRVRLNALYQARPNLFVGLRYWMDDFQITETEEEGLLAQGAIPGSTSSFLSGAGVVLNYDNRDRIFFPTQGVYLETVLFYNGGALGSDFNFSKLYLDASYFWNYAKKHIIGVNFYAELTQGTAPFNQLSLLGGTKRMRGFFEGRFRDKQLLSSQAEYRFPIFGRFGGVIFAASGAVADDFANFQVKHIRFAAGLGLRFVLDQKEHVNLRLDAGFSKSSSGYYLTVAEAF